MSNLLVVTGPPGSGKSTLARIVADHFGRSVLVEGDAFFAFVAKGAIQPWLREANAQNETVTQAAAAAAGRYALGGFLTVYDGIVGPWFLPTFLEASGLVSIDYVILLPPLDRCIKRVATRLEHGFRDEAATRAMHRQFAEALLPRRHFLVDPPEDSGKVADAILESFEGGLLRYPGAA